MFVPAGAGDRRDTSRLSHALFAVDREVLSTVDDAQPGEGPGLADAPPQLHSGLVVPCEFEPASRGGREAPTVVPSGNEDPASVERGAPAEPRFFASTGFAVAFAFADAFSAARVVRCRAALPRSGELNGLADRSVGTQPVGATSVSSGG